MATRTLIGSPVGFGLNDFGQGHVSRVVSWDSVLTPEVLTMVCGKGLQQGVLFAGLSSASILGPGIFWLGHDEIRILFSDLISQFGSCDPLIGTPKRVPEGSSLFSGCLQIKSAPNNFGRDLYVRDVSGSA